MAVRRQARSEGFVVTGEVGQRPVGAVVLGNPPRGRLTHRDFFSHQSQASALG